MESLEEFEKVRYFKEFFKAIIISVSISLILIFILAFLISNTNLKENMINPSIIFISSISILIGSFLVSKKIKRKGIIYGAIVGIIYMLLMYIISSLMNMNFLINLNSIIMFCFGILGGAIGGVLGVNL